MYDQQKKAPPFPPCCLELTYLLLTTGTSVYNSAHLTKYAKQNVFKAATKHGLIIVIHLFLFHFALSCLLKY